MFPDGVFHLFPTKIFDLVIQHLLVVTTALNLFMVLFRNLQPLVKVWERSQSLTLVLHFVCPPSTPTLPTMSV